MAAPEARAAAPRGRARTSQGIIGFTEAELGLFLAILFLGLNFIGRPSGVAEERPAAPSPVDSLRAASDPRLTELVALAARVDAMQAVLRTALSRDSSAAARVGSYQTTRDSLRASRVATVGADRPRPDPLRTDEVAARERVVERALAGALLSRDTTRAALRVAERTTDSLRGLVARSAAAVLEARAAASPAAVQALMGSGLPTVRGAGAPGTGGRGGALASMSGSTRVGAAPAGGAGGGAVYYGPGPLGAGGARGMPTGTGAGPGGNGGRVGSAVFATAGRGTGRGRPRSNQIPTCMEIGAARAPIADVTILGRDRYLVRDSVGAIQTVLAVLAPERDRARRLECRQQVRVASDPALGAQDYVEAVNALLPYFDTELVKAGAR